MESILISAERPAWMNQAACKGRTNLFFGIAGERPERRIRREEPLAVAGEVLSAFR